MRLYFNVFVSFLVFINTGLCQQVQNDWFFGAPNADSYGISKNQAYKQIIDKSSTSPVVVAVIDSGIDYMHEDLIDNMWVNHGEIPNNGIDDDRNGYIDDIHGWNFIGGSDGQNVGPDSYEATRVYNSGKYKYENANPKMLNKAQKKEYQMFLQAKNIVENEILKAQNSLDKINLMSERVMNALNAIEEKLEGKTINYLALESIESDGNMDVEIGKMLVTQFLAEDDSIDIVSIKNMITEDIDNDKNYYLNKLNYGYNVDFDPRKDIVKDNYDDPYQRIYGNNDIKGPDALHGTHVGGIIGAIRNNGIGLDGVAPNVKLMSVRAVPDGDERDKDVANAIRYAVDNGAQIINMSFGKGFTTHKHVVDQAIKYAASKDVLLVHAAGNSNQNNDIESNFPTAVLKTKKILFWKKVVVAKNWIEVGALNSKGGMYAAAPFSNYGKSVDLFAPGMHIYSTTPENQYAQLQGTSMASPVVAGIAATIRSLYPALTAVQVKEAIMKSVTPVEGLVYLPGSNTEMVPFKDLCASGGAVNLNAALLYASQMKGKKKVKELPRA